MKKFEAFHQLKDIIFTNKENLHRELIKCAEDIENANTLNKADEAWGRYEETWKRWNEADEKCFAFIGMENLL